MIKLIEKILDAQKYGISIRPEVGGFPVLAEVLRQAGVQINRWSLPACQSIFITKEGSVVQQGVPLLSGTHSIPNFDEQALIAAIRKDQEGKSTFAEFLNSIWQAGVVQYEVDFNQRKVLYSGVNGETYSEKYPAVEIINNL